MSASFFDLMKYTSTGIASPDMTGFDKLRAKAAFGGGYPIRTITGVPPISFKADGKPLTAWSIAGNGQQSGTPTPDNPITPEFVGVRTANLAWTGWAQDFVSRIDNADRASIMTDGGRECLWYNVAAGYGQYDTKYIFKIEWKENTRYDISFYGKRPTGNTATTVARLYYTDDTYENINVPSAGVGNYIRYAVVSAPGKTVKSLCAHFSSGNFLIDINTFMVHEGSTALPYEPYGYKIPITCAGQTVPVYLGQTQTVRRVKKLVLTGEENWNISGSGDLAKFYVNIADAVGSSSLYCTHFTDGTQETSGNCEVTASKNLVFNNSGIATITGNWKTWLSTQYAAGTPVTVWYVLAEPETAIVNEPLCKIGDYADELHSADAGVTIPTAKGTNVMTVDTELQPSSMTITGNIKEM